MTVYTLSAAGLNGNDISQIPYLQWVKLFPGDIDTRRWFVQTFPTVLPYPNPNGTQPDAINDQADTLVYFAQGTPPAPTASSAQGALQTQYDIAIPVGSAIELDPGVDWYVAYPVHGVYNIPATSQLKPNQFVTIVTTRYAGSYYPGESGDVSAGYAPAVANGDALSSPAGGAMLAWANNNPSIPNNVLTVVPFTTNNLAGANAMFEVGNVTLTAGGSAGEVAANGVYDIVLNLGFFPNAAGQRYVGLGFSGNGAAYNPASDPIVGMVAVEASSIANTGVMPNVTFRGYLKAWTQINVVVFQNSGAALIVVSDRSIINIRQVA